MAHHRPSRRAALAGLSAAVLSGATPPALARLIEPGLMDAAARRAASLDQLHAMVVARNGEIAFARAFRGPALDRPVNIKSVSKTIVALVTGAAIDRGVIAGPDQPVAELLGDRMPRGGDPRLNRITVDHLISMRAGLERTSGANYGAWVNSRDWVAYALTRPFVAEPGAAMQYSTGSFHIMAAALTHASGRSLLDLTRAWLGEPLGIDVPPWTRDPQGIFMGGNEMALSPLALIRVGEMARQGGVWDGRQVLSRAWIEASWQARVRSPFSRHDYGYGWFLSQARGHRVMYGRGYGGQVLYVVPGLGLTVAITSDPMRPARSAGHMGDLHDLLANHVIPAVERA